MVLNLRLPNLVSFLKVLSLAVLVEDSKIIPNYEIKSDVEEIVIFGT